MKAGFLEYLRTLHLKVQEAQTKIEVVLSHLQYFLSFFLSFYYFFSIYRSDLAEGEIMLRTKAMRERAEIKERRKYRFCLIRIRFPDGLVLQVCKAFKLFSVVRFYFCQYMYRVYH